MPLPVSSLPTMRPPTIRRAAFCAVAGMWRRGPGAWGHPGLGDTEVEVHRDPDSGAVVLTAVRPSARSVLRVDPPSNSPQTPLNLPRSL